MVKNNLEREIILMSDLAGDKIKNQVFNNGVEWKSRNDPVTKLDRDTEIFLKKYINEKYSNNNFVGEEYGIENNGGNLTWYIDPIDGTKSFLKRIFETSISIAVENEELEKITNSSIFDFMKNLMYIGSESGRKLLFKKNLEDGFEEIYNIKNVKFQDREILVDGKAKGLESKLNRIEGIKTKRQQGSIALAMAQTAFGVYDGMAFYNPNKGNSWDVATGYHLLSCEDDFEICDYFGDKFDFRDPKNGMIALRKDLPENVKEVFRNYNL